MATLSSFLPYVLPWAVGCPDPLVYTHLNNTLIDFCTRSLIYQVLDTQDVLASTQDYDIYVPTGAKIVKVMGVWYKDTWLAPNPTEVVRSGLAERGNVDSTTTVTITTPQIYFQKTPTDTSIALYPYPYDAVSGGLAIRCAYAPQRSNNATDTVPDVLFDKWAEVIASGVVSRIAAIPNQSFTNPSLAATSKVDYETGVRKAANLARTGQVASASRVQMRNF